jgi:hypothetical protein
MVIGMYPEALEKVRRLDSGMRLGYTAHEPAEENIRRALGMGAHHIGILPRHLTPELVARCRARGLAVRCTHAHTDAEIRRALDSGVCGLVHSDARVLREYLQF